MMLKPVRNICLVLDDAEAAACRKRISEAPPGVDAFELRIDLLREEDRTPLTVGSLIAAAVKPVVATCRSEAEGGAATIADERREELLQAAHKAGAALIDLEWAWVNRDPGLFRRFPPDRTMVSHHCWNGMPADAGELLSRMMATPARALKLVVCPRSFDDVGWLRDATGHAQRAGRLASCFAVGPFARVSRILSALAGAHLIYAGRQGESPASPDLLPVREAVDIYRLGDLSDTVKLLGILGHPVARSLSPRMHNEVIRVLGERYIYVPFDSPEPEPVIEFARRQNMRGLSVTIPHKVRVMPLLNGLDQTARDAGAVNTIVNTNHTLIGYNTDLIACRSIFREWAAGPGDRAVLAGSGGAARSVARALTEAHVPFMVLSRDADRGRRFAAGFGATYGGSPLSGEKFDGSIYVNATPMGFSDEPVEHPVRLHRGLAVLDLAYRPGETALVVDARAAGSRVVSGLDFLARQGACAFALWTRRIVNVDLFRSALETSRAGSVLS